MSDRQNERMELDEDIVREEQQYPQVNENIERAEQQQPQINGNNEHVEPQLPAPPPINENVEQIAQQLNYNVEELVPMMNSLLVIAEPRAMPNENIQRNEVVPIRLPVPPVPAPEEEHVLENADIANMGQRLLQEFRERQRNMLNNMENVRRLNPMQDLHAQQPVRRRNIQQNYEIIRYPAVDAFLARHPVFHALLLDLAMLGGLLAYYTWEFFLKYLVLFVYSIFIFSEVVEEEGRIIFQSVQRYFRRFDRILRDTALFGPTRTIRALYRITRIFFNYQMLNNYRALRNCNGREVIEEEPPYRPLLIEMTIFFPYVLKIVLCIFAIVFYYLCAGFFAVVFRPNNM